MKAVMLKAPRKAMVVDAHPPVLGAGEVVIRIDASGLCGSDVSTWSGHHPFRRPPVILGHEAAGTVVAVAPDVTTSRIGTRVALCPLIPCRTCRACLKGFTNLCQARRVPGVGWSGTYADYVSAPADRAFAVADSTGMAAAALIEPTTVALRACRQAGVAAGVSVGILGAGGIGFLSALVAAHLGASELVVTDVSSAKLSRLSQSIEVRTVLTPSEDPVAIASEVTAGEGLDAVIVTSASQAALDQAIVMTRPGGVLVMVALPGRVMPVDFDACVVKEMTLRGTYAYTDRDFANAVELVDSGKVDVLAAMTHTVPLDEAPSIFERIENGLQYTKIIFTNEAERSYESELANTGAD
jgi:L-iditol 2-dehydrogenase